jgi:type 1 glutamine amidotransferase
MRIAAAALLLWAATAPAQPPHIVLVAGDEEYRSEEALPMLARILQAKHGSRCTVLHAINPETGEIDPENQRNIPGLEALRTADLMVIFTRFRDLPDEQMRYIVDYVEAGKPVIGIRTATHAFQLRSTPTYARWSWNSREWDGGFGRQVLGETWIRHHGKHGEQGTRARIAPGAEGHPILRGIRDGEIWGPTDVYAVRLPLPEGCRMLLLGEVTDGMTPDAPPAAGAVNNPMMPVAWTRTYKGGRVFTLTMGSAQDFENAGLRRLLVNAVYWALGLESRIRADFDVAPLEPYRGTPFGFGKYVRGRKP